MLEGARKRYPQIRVEEVPDEIDVHGVYSNDPFGIKFNVGEPNAERSIVKSAVALACEAGLKPEHCDAALRYLRNEENDYEEDGLWHYYEQDLVKNRTIGLPLHCVYIAGSPSSGLLLAYVEYYGVVRVVMSLSQVYNGDTVRQRYSIDPVTGRELDDVEIDLDDLMFKVIKAQTAEGLRAGAIKAMEEVLGSGTLLSRGRSIAELCVESVNAYCERNGVTVEMADRRELVEEVAQRLIPLIKYYSEPLEFPEGFDPTTTISG